MISLVAPVLWSLPWVVAPVAALLSWRGSRSLDDVSPQTSSDAPLVSIVVPARNERRNIERCVRSILAGAYSRFELIVVDDHSDDGTGDLARTIASNDPRCAVIEAPNLPAGWFGKQWACAAGAARAHGDVLVFTDADTWHAPDLIPRVVNAMRERDADLLSVAGHQETHSFWERVVQPQVFALLLFRYGGTERVSNAKRETDVIANGQFIAMRRDAYDAVGGHALVREKAAEDMALAQAFFRAGRRVVLIAGTAQLSTHMYASLRELVGGWRKNIYASGREAALGGAVGRALYPLFLLGWPLIGLAPSVALLLAAFGVLSTAWLTWAAIAVVAALAFWMAIYRFMKQPLWYAVLYPLGLAMLGYIAAGAVARGQRVEWKQRTYIAR